MTSDCSYRKKKKNYLETAKNLSRSIFVHLQLPARSLSPVHSWVGLWIRLVVKGLAWPVPLYIVTAAFKGRYLRVLLQILSPCFVVNEEGRSDNQSRCEHSNVCDSIFNCGVPGTLVQCANQIAFLLTRERLLRDHCSSCCEEACAFHCRTIGQRLERIFGTRCSTEAKGIERIAGTGRSRSGGCERRCWLERTKKIRKHLFIRSCHFLCMTCKGQHGKDHRNFPHGEEDG
mmetsp:Transcript_62372/g.103716  ORF Transcript_62372/g.103716 Transcript_62372/m.103716 type:complete len:231 (+) Transcript_62372:181-873(+)